MYSTPFSFMNLIKVISYMVIACYTVALLIIFRLRHRYPDSQTNNSIFINYLCRWRILCFFEGELELKSCFTGSSLMSISLFASFWVFEQPLFFMIFQWREIHYSIHFPPNSRVTTPALPLTTQRHVINSFIMFYQVSKPVIKQSPRFNNPLFLS